jgi:phytoene dehydrogenase-like protein
MLVKSFEYWLKYVTNEAKDNNLAKLKKFLAKFPDDAKSWDEATDEIRDMSRIAKEYYNDMDLDLLEDEDGALQPLNFRAFNTPSEWNTKGKEYILSTYAKMSNNTKDQFIDRFQKWL